MYEIRELIIDDYREIYQLNRDEMGYDYLLEKTKEKIIQLTNSPKDKIYVALIENKLVAYVHANDYDVLYAPHMKNIMGIAVSSNWKRHGIGKALINRVEDWAKQTGAEGIRVVSGSLRSDAHAFYHSCGYGSDKTQLNLTKTFYLL